jgi:hypothetical protein
LAARSAFGEMTVEQAARQQTFLFGGKSRASANSVVVDAKVPRVMLAGGMAHTERRP